MRTGLAKGFGFLKTWSKILSWSSAGRVRKGEKDAIVVVLAGWLFIFVIESEVLTLL